ncbi:MAG TPA: DUF4350 domain-containing protein, partial [Chroococcales cyanobacterium]
MKALGQLWHKLRSDRFFAQLLALIAVSTVAVYIGLSFDEHVQSLIPEGKANASTYNRKPSGLSGLLSVLESSGLTCRQWLLPYRLLPKQPGVLVIISPLESLEEFETNQIANWVRSGHDLIYLDSFSFNFTKRLLYKCGLSVDAIKEIRGQRISPLAGGDDERLDHVGALIVTADSLVAGGTKLVPFRDGSLFAEISLGKGHVIVGSAPD